ncbi:MAG: hypothetical protein DI551_09500 [Micavibrio aeruginosavorus]|uniref:DUF883 domain-containing protein n=1 Tax=Micavibrio aeruginosavorus TaxID=349221 RepID=A0A2W5Q079_9BACT|nr:MAG: hypothetical protein DI551_09500 [Micavibrio aeruginosavorus]
MTNSISKEVANMKSKADISPIREDLETLKEDAKVLRDDARTLGRDLKTEGRKQLSRAEEIAMEKLEIARERGRDGIAELGNFVQANPVQSLAVAFVGGMLASLFFGRRG